MPTFKELWVINQICILTSLFIRAYIHNEFNKFLTKFSLESHISILVIYSFKYTFQLTLYFILFLFHLNIFNIPFWFYKEREKDWIIGGLKKKKINYWAKLQYLNAIVEVQMY